MTHRVEKLLDIKLECPAWPRVVSTYLTSKLLQTVDSGMGTLPDSAGVTIKDERLVKKRIQHAVYSVMYQSVTDGRLVDDPMFGIKNVETVIGTMTVLPIDQLVVERKNIVLQVPFKLLHILPSPLSTTELAKSDEKIF